MLYVSVSIMEDKQVIIVTGANIGIGLQTAIGLCELGHDVVISVRDDAKGEAAIADIKEAVPNAKVSYIIMEMSDPGSIREFVKQFRATGKSLNVLVNNAGLVMPMENSQRYSARGNESLEATMTVNCMGPFLLTQLLLDDLKSTATDKAPSRIVNVSSGLTVMKRASMQGFFINDLMLAEEGHYRNGGQAYRNSKLAMNLWTLRLAADLRGTNVIANTVCPGFIPSTGLGRNMVNSWRGLVNLRLHELVATLAYMYTCAHGVGMAELLERRSVGHKHFVININSSFLWHWQLGLLNKA